VCAACATRQAYAEATSWSATALCRGWDALRGLATGESDSLASFAGALTCDLYPLGDVRDITVQPGIKAKSDDLIFGLSVLGLALTAANFVAPQQAVPMRNGEAAPKTATRFAKVSSGGSANIRRITTSIVDLSAFKQAARKFDITRSGPASPTPPVSAPPAGFPVDEPPFEGHRRTRERGLSGRCRLSRLCTPAV
jgi:hypothetical protein